MVEQTQCHGVASSSGDVVAVVAEVADHLVDAVHPQGAEVVAQRAQVALAVRVKALVHIALHHFALDLQHVAALRQQGVELRQQGRLIAGV